MFDSPQFFLVNHPFRFHKAERLHHFDQVNRIDDSYPSSCYYSLDGLCIQQIGIHLCVRVDKPCPDMLHGCIGIYLFPRKYPGGSKVAYQLAHANHGLPMCCEILRIGFSVPADIRTVGSFRIRPPVITLRIEVMNTSGTSCRTGSGHSDRFLMKCGICPLYRFFF